MTWTTEKQSSSQELRQRAALRALLYLQGLGLDLESCLELSLASCQRARSLNPNPSLAELMDSLDFILSQRLPESAGQDSAADRAKLVSPPLTRGHMVAERSPSRPSQESCKK